VTGKPARGFLISVVSSQLSVLSCRFSVEEGRKCGAESAKKILKRRERKERAEEWAQKKSPPKQSLSGAPKITEELGTLRRQSYGRS
jgi:hypothetical protein